MSGDLFNGQPSPRLPFTVGNFKPHVSGSLRGFLDVTLEDTGLTIIGCTAHVSHESWWIGLPGKPRLSSDGQPMRDERGRVSYAPAAQIRDRAYLERFKDAVLAELDRLHPGWSAA